MFRAGGVLFSVEPEDALTEAERDALGRLDRAEDGPPQEPLLIELVPEAPWTSDDARLYPRWEPAVQRWADGRLLCSHRSFTAEIDPTAGRARIQRREERAYPLEVVIRTAMLARLPLLGGLPLHAAGVVLEGGAIGFFGPSGAGKTTLAASCPGTVLSDELVAISPGDPFTLVRSGFWGEGRGPARVGGARLVALVALSRGPSFCLTRLGAAEAVRSLVGSMPIPLAPPLWSRALAVATDVVSHVPVYRMAWTPSEPPWERLTGALAKISPRT
jgi:hypothetical protein